jgi:hypothetical protein
VPRISFGSRQDNRELGLAGAVELVAADFARRYKDSTAEIAARGSSNDFASWVTVDLQVSPQENADACVEWFVAQLARLGVTLITDLHGDAAKEASPSGVRHRV